MRIFISWSGAVSRQAAEILKDWIPCVLQSAKIYVSSRDIGKGERWHGSVTSNLNDHDFGISVLTSSNLVAPWILFEAGALSKSLKSRLIPFLFKIDDISIINHPLSHFQYIRSDRQEEIASAIREMNAFSEKPIADELLQRTFERWYPDLQAALDAIEDDQPTPVPSQTERDELIGEALVTLMGEVRSLRQDFEHKKNDDRIAHALIGNASDRIIPRGGFGGFGGLGRPVNRNLREMGTGLFSGILAENPDKDISELLGIDAETQDEPAQSE